MTQSHKGLAQLCFLPTWFQGHFLPTSSPHSNPPTSNLSLVGTPAPEDTHPAPHPCCPRTAFWHVRIRDWDRGLEAECIVQQRGAGGDCVVLSTEFEECEDGPIKSGVGLQGRVEFETTCVKVEEDAVQHMKRFFKQLTPTTTAVVCLGEMQIDDLEFRSFE
ncbi:hypothetical protein PhCBS80983_g03007 [Powellomyces hirtus]|uniref:Uncharacterized protein n=1 Tax=Powellomyces hirtus TaxID=109895 RepID=A0A507E6B7_9FUNG|nr:hypothetical protein PhCBS80983_g03007 [Powellomyces hirtus]